MIVYKFGGASVKDIEGISNLVKIVKDAEGKLLVVVSALGKTTNALEELVKIAYRGDGDIDSHLENIWGFHKNIIDRLLPEGKIISDYIRDSLGTIIKLSSDLKGRSYDFIYDQIVSFGEIWSTKIVEAVLKQEGLKSCWIDMRETLITDDRYRDANVMVDDSSLRLKGAIERGDADICVLQGFIGGTLSGDSTTLGREGSDYTAGIVANILDAEKVIIWKDVPGIMNADPEWMLNPERLENISYKEAVEMTFSGAKVIHPKTIKPLHNKGIPLYVKSFLDPSLPGTVISSNTSNIESVPVFVRKENQVLLSITPADFSFVMGESLGTIFSLFYKYGIKTNLVQASAVSIVVCVDNDAERISRVTDTLKGEFTILYNENVELVTIRYYNKESVKRITGGRSILLEQKTRRAIRYVLKSVSTAGL